MIEELRFAPHGVEVLFVFYDSDLRCVAVECLVLEVYFALRRLRLDSFPFRCEIAPVT